MGANSWKYSTATSNSLVFKFFQMPLAAFPQTFGLRKLKKGYFPRKFNTPDHQDYVGKLLATDYYVPEIMSP